MPRYLVDANLPRWFNQWNSADYVHQHEIDPTQHDARIWDYAKDRELSIITKDSDFSSRILLSAPPPKVIHIRLGNMDMRSFHQAITQCWQDVLDMNATHKLVIVYADRIKGVK